VLIANEPSLQPLLRSYTPRQVLDAALETLGYPPTWMLGTDSILKVQAELKRNGSKETARLVE
jgi:hypothetical protein